MLRAIFSYLLPSHEETLYDIHYDFMPLPTSGVVFMPIMKKHGVMLISD